MVITGQPKNTAEYIQASSRVGREHKGSGLVFMLYNHARSRDRSHFENFVSYHQALYKNVNQQVSQYCLIKFVSVASRP